MEGAATWLRGKRFKWSVLLYGVYVINSVYTCFNDLILYCVFVRENGT